MKKIIVFKSDLLPYSETFIKQQIAFLKDWDAVLVGNRRVHGLDLDEIHIEFLEPVKPSSSRKVWRELNKLLWRPFGADVSIVKACDPSLVHAHFGTDGVAFYPVARKLKLPMIVTLHGVDINVHRDWWESGKFGWGNRTYPERLLQMGKEGVSFIAVSNAIRQRAIEFGLPPERVKVNYIGVDTQFFKPEGQPISERARRILFVGRLVEKKGCEYLIRAFREVYIAVQNSELFIVGDGPLRTSLEALARKLDIPVKFLGPLNPFQVKKCFDQARVLCLPSVHASNGDAEGFGMVILEAQACGVPVVTSAKGGAIEGLRDGLTGYAFPERDIDILVDRLLKLITDDKLATSMAAEATKFISECFDIRKCNQKLESFYDQVFSEHYLSEV